MQNEYKVSIKYQILNISKCGYIMKSKTHIVSAANKNEAKKIAWNRILKCEAFCKFVSCYIWR